MDEDEDEDEGEKLRRRKERRKRRRAEREQQEEILDEEDLDLIGEANPELARHTMEEPKFKRLKRGHKEDDSGKGAPDLFDTDEEDEQQPTMRGNRVEDEFDDFIEEDFPDDEEGAAGVNDAEVSRIRGRDIDALKAGLDEDSLEDFHNAFGDGTDYQWALDLEKKSMENERMVTENGHTFSKPLELKDVFEPSQLIERMLTDDDNLIRATDEPERFQLARKSYKKLILTDEQQKEEAGWIANQMWDGTKAQVLGMDLRDHFQKAIAKVLEFYNVDEVEAPFIFQHRKDYLLHIERITGSPGGDDKMKPHKLLDQADLWEVFRQDLRYRALIEKRNALERTYNNLKNNANVQDPVIDELLPAAVEMEELQDLQEYLHFQHASKIADLTLLNAGNEKKRKRPGSGRVVFEKIRNSKLYSLVRGFGITADAFAQNAAKQEGRRQYTEDPSDRPEVMASSEDILDPPEYTSASHCLKAAKSMFAEELYMSPRLRKTIRMDYYKNAVLWVQRKDQAIVRIDELHPYWDFKYLRNQNLRDILENPGRFLRMLKAEEDSLIDIKIGHKDFEGLRKSLLTELESDNFSEVAEAWNRERREALGFALAKLDKIMLKSIKEFLKSRSEVKIATEAREGLYYRLDQAPYKPKGLVLGTVPRVLAISNGDGNVGRDPVNWVFVDDDGRVMENGRFVELYLGDSERGTRDGSDVGKLVEVIQRRKPDVISVSGTSVDTIRLQTQVENIIKSRNLRGADYDDEDNNSRSDELEVVLTNEEVARFYQNSERGKKEYPSLAPLTRYCVALARYLQNPLKEYTAMGKDIIAVKFEKDQRYLPDNFVLSYLETAICDIVNLVGVDINEALVDPRTAALLPYVAGLGPRKAQHMLRIINNNGGSVITRAELVGDPDQGKAQAIGPRVWNNCSSFLFIEYDVSNPASDYLDNTRVHPEDYELGRKMAADALELDEEDIEGEITQEGGNAILRKLIRDEAQEKVNDLILEDYSEQLELRFNQKKRSTLETIRAELQMPFEELRHNFQTRIQPEEKFTMLTGQTTATLNTGMITTLLVKRVSDDTVSGRLSCGIEATVNMMEISKPIEVSARTLYQPHQAVRAYIISVSRDLFRTELSLLEEKVTRRYRPRLDYAPDEWDDKQEEADIESLKPKDVSTGRVQRVVRHPLFKALGFVAAEQFLASQGRGDLVIRPSSRGPDHLAVTWKVADRVYQHLDVLELNKENEFSVGKILKVGNATYSDLDELIVSHVKAMARKVEEMINCEKYQRGTKADTGKFFFFISTLLSLYN